MSFLVTENRKGELHGWASYRQIEPVSTLGQTVIRGGGLGACRRDRPGAYAGLVRAATERIHGAGGVTEMQTQIFNFATIRLYESVDTHFVRAARMARVTGCFVPLSTNVQILAFLTRCD